MVIKQVVDISETGRGLKRSLYDFREGAYSRLKYEMGVHRVQRYR